jgi:hypothetical protein
VGRDCLLLIDAGKSLGSCPSLIQWHTHIGRGECLESDFVIIFQLHLKSANNDNV